MNTMKVLRVFFLTILLLGSGSAFATVIGTFSGARLGVTAAFNLFTGNLMNSAAGALAADGHTLVNLDAGIGAGSLVGIDTVYLTLPNGSSNVLSAAEAAALYVFVNLGGNLIVQGDCCSFGTSYNNVASLFGVSYTGAAPAPGAVSLASFAPLTNGPHGTASSLATATTGVINPGSAPGLSLANVSGGSMLFVMGPETGYSGLGRAIFLADINSFDDPENTNGYAQADGAAFWRNMFALPSGTAIPEPGTLALIVAALAGLKLRRRVNAPASSPLWRASTLAAPSPGHAAAVDNTAMMS